MLSEEGDVARGVKGRGAHATLSLEDVQVNFLADPSGSLPLELTLLDLPEGMPVAQGDAVALQALSLYLVEEAMQEREEVLSSGRKETLPTDFSLKRQALRAAFSHPEEARDAYDDLYEEILDIYKILTDDAQMRVIGRFQEKLKRLDTVSGAEKENALTQNTGFASVFPELVVDSQALVRSSQLPHILAVSRALSNAAIEKTAQNLTPWTKLLEEKIEALEAAIQVGHGRGEAYHSLYHVIHSLYTLLPAETQDRLSAGLPL